MPVRSCGSKVDRLQPKLQCILCNQVYHAKCCNINANEIDFCKNIFKCSSCLKTRRSPLSSLSALPDVSVNKLDVEVDGTVTNTDADDAVFDFPEVSVADATVAVRNDGDSASDSLLLNGDTIIVTDSEPTMNVTTLESLSKEVVFLRNLAVTMADTIKSLQNENAKTNAKLDEAFCLLKSLPVAVKESLEFSSSPKRKKISSCNDTITVVGSKIANGHSDGTCAQTEMEAVGNNNAMSLVDRNWPVVGTGGKKKAAVNRTLTSNSPGGSFVSISHPDNEGNTARPSNNFQSPMILENNAGWNRVGKRAKSKNSLIGTGAKNNLGIVNNFKWLHLSSFNNNVTEADIINYLTKSTNISASNFFCFKLVKKDEDITKLKFINFKLGIVSNSYEDILSPALWPANVRVRPFANFLETPTSLPQSVEISVDLAL